MARFRFTLQAVLRQRELTERERQRKLAQRQLAAMDADRRLTELRERLEAERQATRALAVGGDIAGVRRQGLAIGWIARAMAGAEEELATAQQEVETARAALARAAVDRKVVELLRDRRRAAWLADLNRREQGELDELAVIRAAGGAGARKDGER